MTKMNNAAKLFKGVLGAVAVILAIGFFASARAADLPLAAGSPLSGVAFDDKPLLLPVQRNFQMAMLTSSSELGRSCGKMEAYGWRMNQTEQARVNQIFNNTVDRLRMAGYAIEPQKLSSITNDITLFTADKPHRHFIFLWSAGELGLVMTLCETSAPPATSARAVSLDPSVQVFPVPAGDIVSSRLDPAQAQSFTPLGEWEGGYTCAQGYTGGTLKITQLKGKDFQGVFRFYPTPKNPSVPTGSYTVNGQYDAQSKRILINPGAWIMRPRNFYNTVIVGSFDPQADSFSAYFQGVTSCTSFEAKRRGPVPVNLVTMKPVKKAKHVAKKKHVVAHKPKPTPVVAPVLAPTPVPAPESQMSAPPTNGTGAPLPDMLVATPPVAAPAPPVPVAPALVPTPAAVDNAPADIKKDPDGIKLSAPGSDVK